MYPNDDLVYTIGVSDYRRDWFFAHVPRKKGDVYEGTTWQIRFKLENVDQKANYKLRVAIASATLAELQVRMKFSHVYLRCTILFIKICSISAGESQ